MKFRSPLVLLLQQMPIGWAQNLSTKFPSSKNTPPFSLWIETNFVWGVKRFKI
jgi:hypothetical protein